VQPENLLASLASYRKTLLPLYAKKLADERREEQVLAQFSELLTSKEACFHNDHFDPGHCTGSALVVNPELDRVVLTFHRKLKKWLQVGGHADGHPAIHEVALREAREESGLEKLRFFSSPILPIDWDIHQIPERSYEPAHLHYDVRYLLIADDTELRISEESLDLRWFGIQDLASMHLDASVTRLIEKLALFKENLCQTTTLR
jgi:8-oxo-dGTP pyrophosphatase MutT (NUDIX family)